MASSTDWFSRALTNISNEIDVINTLSEFKIGLACLNSSQLKHVASSLQLGIVFDCLNSSDKNQIELACEILKTLLSALDPAVVLSQYGVAMLRALAHPSKEANILALQEMYRAVCESDLSSRLSQEEPILLKLIECIGYEDMSVAKISVSFFERFGATVSNLNVLYSPPLLKALNDVMKENDIVRFRVYEIVVDVSATSLPGLQASHDCGLLKELIDEVNKPDILAKLTALELITKLALTHHGLEYLENNSVTTSLADRVTNSASDIFASLLLPGLIKFFGNVAQLRPKEVFTKYPQVIAVVFDSFHSPDRNLAGIAMETIGYVATTSEGKHCLQKYESSMLQVMKQLSKVIDLSPTEDRVRALNTVANIIQLEETEQNSEMLSLTEKWFYMLSEDPITKVADLCRQPFPEIKLAGCLILQNVAHQEWGQHLINKCPGLLEFLMDRDVEPNLQCKTAKFKVIETLANSHTAASVFGEIIHLRLQEFVKEGPCFVYTQTEVAIEGAS